MDAGNWAPRLVVAGIALAFAAPAAAKGEIVDQSVSFVVKNTNSSRVPCASDGADYTVSGHLVGPAAALRSARAKAATLYVHGLDVNEGFWRFGTVPGYDYAIEMAKAGFISVTVDKLGYGASGQPDGSSSCIGAQADVVHQVITSLRRGDYRAAGTTPVPFHTVALAGHSNGGATVQAEAYSFADIDALLVMSWADQGFTTAAEQSFAMAGRSCLTGGEQSPQGSGGYAYFGQTEDDFRAEFFHSATPDVVAAAGSLRSVNPCGDMSSIPPTIATDNTALSEITVPVLLISGEDDQVFGADGVRQQRDHYSGSADVSLAMLVDTGHALTLEATAPQFRATVASWLRARGLASQPGPPPPRGHACAVGATTIVGSRKRDTLRGSKGPDAMFGEGGADVLLGGAGRDCLAGGDGGDRLQGGPGGDRLSGGRGHDRIRGGAGPTMPRLRCSIT